MSTFPGSEISTELYHKLIEVAEKQNLSLHWDKDQVIDEDYFREILSRFSESKPFLGRTKALRVLLDDIRDNYIEELDRLQKDAAAFAVETLKNEIIAEWPDVTQEDLDDIVYSICDNLYVDYNVKDYCKNEIRVRFSPSTWVLDDTHTLRKYQDGIKEALDFLNLCPAKFREALIISGALVSGHWPIKGDRHGKEYVNYIEFAQEVACANCPEKLTFLSILDEPLQVLQKYHDENTKVTLKPGTPCGFFSPITGSGTQFECKLIREIQLPLNGIIIDTGKSSVKNVFGVFKDFYGPTLVVD